MSQRYFPGRASWETHVGGLFVVVYIVHVSGEAEVGDLHDVVVRDEDVSGRQVSVDALREETQRRQTELSPPTDFSFTPGQELVSKLSE